MIHIITETAKICWAAWDYPVEELDYLLEEHDGETFVLYNNRLWETKEMIK